MAPLLTVLALVMSLCALVIAWWGGRRGTVSPILTLAWAAHVLLWNVIPLVYRLLFSAGAANIASSPEWEHVAVLQAGSLLALTIAFVAVREPLIPSVKAFFDRHSIAAQRLVVPAMIGLGALIAVEIGVSSIAGSSFGDVTAFSVTASTEDLARVGLLESVLALLVAFALAILSLNRGSGVTRALHYVAWAMILVHAGFSVVRGLRSVVLLPAIAGLIYVTTLQGRARSKAFFAIGVLGTLTVVIGGPLAMAIGLVRATTGGLSLENLREGYQIAVDRMSFTEQVELLASEVNRKFDAIGPGAQLLTLEPGGTGGIQPLVSAALSPIPRVLYPSKPVPTSRDGTYLGTPYRIAAQAYGDPERGMVVPVAASAIAVWELGILGPIVLLIGNLINLLVVNSCLVARHVLLRALGISLLGLPTAEFFIAPGSSLLRDDLRVVVMIVSLGLAVLTLMGTRPRSNVSRSIAG